MASCDVATRLQQLLRLDVLVLTAGLWFLAKALRYAFPPLFEPFRGIYGVSNTELGIAFTGLMVCYAAMQFPSGVWQDRFGPVRVMVTGGIVAALAALALVREPTFLVLVGIMLLIGAATGLHKTVSIPLLARVYSKHTGRAFGFHETLGASAGVAAPILVIFFLHRSGWRSFYVLAGLCGLFFGILAFIRIPPRLEARVDSGSSPDLAQYFGLLRSRRISAFVIVTASFAFAYNGVVAFLPLYLVDVAGLDLSTAGLLYSLLFAATISQLGTGELSDHLGRLPILGACICLGLFGMVLLFSSTTAVGLSLAVAAFGIGTHGYRPVRDAFLTDLIPSDTVGGGIGLIRTLLMGTAAIAPVTVGVMADSLGFRIAFMALMAALGCSFLALVYVYLTDRD